MWSRESDRARHRHDIARASHNAALHVIEAVERPSGSRKRACFVRQSSSRSCRRSSSSLTRVHTRIEWGKPFSLRLRSRVSSTLAIPEGRVGAAHGRARRGDAGLLFGDR